MGVSISEFNSMCMTEIIDDLYRIKRDNALREIWDISMNGGDPSKIDHYRDIMNQYKDKEEDDFDYDAAKKYLDDRKKEWLPEG